MHIDARPLLAPLLACSLVACSGDDGTTGASATDTTTAGTDTDAGTTDTTTGGPLNGFPVGGCGLDEYPLLDAAGMGEILDWQLSLEFTASDIDSLLQLQGFGQLAPVKSGARLYKIRYLTQDRGEAIEATGYLALPTDLGDKVPAGVWLHGTSGFYDACGPTADDQQGFVPLLMAALGYATVAPDYIGLNGWGAASGRLHPYVVPEPTAIASLDSIRALRRFTEGGEGDPEAGVAPTDQTVIWGASEGGFAALWTDRYAPHYAPEIAITAVVASVPPTNALALTKYATESVNPATGALAAALVGNRDWYRAADPLSDALASPLDATIEGILRSECNPSGFDGITEPTQVYTQSMIDNLAAGDIDALGFWGCALSRAGIADLTVERKNDTPILVTLGELDDLVYTPTNHEELPRLCDLGYRIESIECIGADHVEGVTQALPFARDWLEDRIAGKPLTEPCVFGPAVDCATVP